MIVGFIVNPIAGMGGPVGLKGTDGRGSLRAAIAEGAVKSAPARAVAALTGLRKMDLDLTFITCSGEMGKEEMDAAGIAARVVYKAEAMITSGADTKKGVSAFLRDGAQMVVFVGGDGTARDVMDALDRHIPVVGVPAGVKMHSAVFVNTPEELADVAAAFLETGRTKDAEVMDVDEEAFRKGVASAKLYGMMKVPDDSKRLQASKMSYHSGTADEEAEEIGQYFADTMRSGVVYILGPGSTTAAIARAIGAEKTLLGVDVYLDRKRVQKDASERVLLKLLSEGREAEVIVTPIGAQGFFLGRGNQQISPQVLAAVGLDRLTVVATPTKLAGTPVLRVDSGDSGLDNVLRGRRKVVTGYKRRKLVRVE